MKQQVNVLLILLSLKVVMEQLVQSQLIVNLVMAHVQFLLPTLFMNGTAENLVKTVIRFVKGMTRHVHLVPIIMRMDQNGHARGVM